MWTTPPKVKVTSFAIKEYGNYRLKHSINPLDMENLPLSHTHEQTFVSELFSALDKKYPGKKKYKDTYASGYETKAIAKNFRNAVLYHSEFVFFSGHGDQQELCFYDYSVNLQDRCWKDVCTEDDYGKVYGGETRWVILDACLALNVNKSNKINLPLTVESVDFQKVNKLRSVFSGVHAILGYYSDGWQYEASIHSKWVRTDRLFRYFVENFIENGETVWNAFNMAGAQLVADFEYVRGLKPAIAFLRGYDKNGIYHDTSTETFDRTYNKPILIDGTLELFVMYAEYGTPTYHGMQ